MQSFRSYTSVSSDGVLFVFDINISWEITDDEAFSLKYSDINLFKRVIDVRTKLAIVDIVKYYSSEELNSALGRQGMKKDEAIMFEIKQRLTNIIEKDNTGEKDSCISIMNFDIGIHRPLIQSEATGGSDPAP